MSCTIGFEVLRQACEHESSEHVINAIGLALEKGVSIRALGSKGETILHHALGSGKVLVAEWLVRQGLSLSAHDDRGDDPMRYYIAHVSSRAFEHAVAP